LVEDTFCGPFTALPSEGSLVLVEDMPIRAGGCAANVAIDLAKQGTSVDVVGCVGQDGAANVLLKTFETHRVGTSRISSVSTHGTSRTVILLVEGQDRRYLHILGANRAFSIEHIDRDWLRKLKVFYLGGLFALPGVDLEQLRELLSVCRSAHVRTVVDVVVPQGVNGMSQIRELLPLIDVFVPNEDEAHAFTGFTEPLDQLNAFESAGANTVIITRGRHGSVAVQDGKRWSCGTYQMKVVDPSGSGDAFTSGVIRSILLGWNLPQTLRYASAIGASATRAAGTTESVFSSAEAEVCLQDHHLTVTESH
jgi:sugar/nucleoside kinase (ribokinase family)